jgi:hypothetical protein
MAQSETLICTAEGCAIAVGEAKMSSQPSINSLLESERLDELHQASTRPSSPDLNILRLFAPTYPDLYQSCLVIASQIGRLPREQRRWPL